MLTDMGLDFPPSIGQGCHCPLTSLVKLDFTDHFVCAWMNHFHPFKGKACSVRMTTSITDQNVPDGCVRLRFYALAKKVSHHFTDMVGHPITIQSFEDGLINMK